MMFIVHTKITGNWMKWMNKFKIIQVEPVESKEDKSTEDGKAKEDKTAGPVAEDKKTEKRGRKKKVAAPIEVARQHYWKEKYFWYRYWKKIANLFSWYEIRMRGVCKDDLKPITLLNLQIYI